MEKTIVQITVIIILKMEIITITGQITTTITTTIKNDTTIIITIIVITMAITNTNTLITNGEILLNSKAPTVNRSRQKTNGFGCFARK